MSHTHTDRGLTAHNPITACISGPRYCKRDGIVGVTKGDETAAPHHPHLWNQVLRVRGAPHHRLHLWNQVLQAGWYHRIASRIASRFTDSLPELVKNADPHYPANMLSLHVDSKSLNCNRLNTGSNNGICSNGFIALHRPRMEQRVKVVVRLSKGRRRNDVTQGGAER